LLTEKQIEGKTRPHPRQNKEVNAIRFAPKVCEATYTKQSTNTNDEERQNRGLKVVSGCKSLYV
jgi:hypothetical protein